MPAVAVAPAHRRHDISDRVWEILEPLLPGGKGKTGRPAQDNRCFINAVFWILRTGAPWRDRNVWAGLLEAVMDDPDYEWLMLDASYIKAHPHSAGARGGNQAIARTKGGSTASCTWRWTPTECR